VIGVVNAAMFGTEAAPGEQVDWSAPDLFTPEEFAEIGLGDPASYAASNPHMIVFEAEVCDNCRQPVRRMFGVLVHDRDDLVGALPHCSTGGTKVALSTI
jgi:hypothetical protein